ncbi:MAG: M50 family metallopeptidase [Chloroflexota bacterium]|nr:M50 family metallopeptidase [Chloroflexota bacterium]
MNNWYLLAAIPVFGLLVLVHEFGHFITAKWAGIRVEEFGLGFPPRIVGVRKRDTGGWEVIWLNGRRNAEDAYSDQKQTPFSGTSGGVSTFESTEPNHTLYSLNFIPIGGFVRMPGENGDIHDENGNYDPQSFAAKPAGKRFIVLVAGVTMNFLLAMVLFTVAYGLGEPTFPPLIGQVALGSPAATAGLRSDDKILSVNGQPVKTFADVGTVVRTALAADKSTDPQATVPVHLVVQRTGESTPISITVNARLHPPKDQGAMGVVEKVVFVSSPLWQAPIKGVQYTFEQTGAFIGAIVQMITGALKPQIGGPVAIVQITGQVAQTVPDLGWWPILSLTALLSINLAIINILPFPALDGGRIVLVLIEVLRGGKRLKPEREGIINFIGMAILLLFMLVITISDVMHWGG